MTGQTEEKGLVHGRVDVGGVRLRYVEAGEGPLVVLLHGFPECWYAWRHQIPALAAAGYRVVAPDMRGYGASDKPPHVRDYAPRILARDVERLVHALGEERAVVVGHDWGGGVAWLVASWHPDVVDRLVVLNCPHPVRLLRGMRSLRQLRRSWYMFFFQIPRLPEAMVRAGDYRVIRRLLASEPVHPEAFGEDDVERYVDAFRDPGALTGGMNYYRAMMRDIGVRKELVPVRAPTLVVWGQRDTVLGSELAEPDPGWVGDLSVVRIADAGHFVQNDAPEEVNQAMIAFLGHTPPVGPE